LIINNFFYHLPTMNKYLTQHLNPMQEQNKSYILYYFLNLQHQYIMVYLK